VRTTKEAYYKKDSVTSDVIDSIILVISNLNEEASSGDEEDAVMLSGDTLSYILDSGLAYHVN
jgi:hypothetical protein